MPSNAGQVTLFEKPDSKARQTSRRSRPRVRNERQGREVAQIAATASGERSESATRTLSELAGQKSDQDARRGGLAARADLTTPEASPKILSASPVSKSLNASGKIRPSGFFFVPSSESKTAAANAAARVSRVAGRSSPFRVTSRGNASPRLRVEFSEPWKIWAEMPRKEKWSSFLDAARKYYQR